ncbi:hypothetical protein PF004_g24296 [Phytophthora fragariae]|uniref:Uncharacterized protein n=1 Tax=Phytophthora fragariae TaxID=53985 RepID=A0A6G0MUL1_9STRA|nr:hypothetical protein PF004_g24296 [Phytophthora fragariae]
MGKRKHIKPHTWPKHWTKLKVLGGGLSARRVSLTKIASTNRPDGRNDRMQHTSSTISTEQTKSRSTYQLKFCTMRPFLPNAKQLKPLNTTDQRPRGRRR